MTKIPRFRLPWRSRESIARAVDDELRFHLEMRAAELVATGISPDDARAAAEREFGDIELTRRICRSEDLSAERRVRLADRLDELRGNIVYAMRSLRRSPGFTTVALATLALAIGANTAVFSVANATLLAALPYDRQGELVALFENNTPNNNAKSDMSAADMLDYRDSQRSFSGLAYFATRGMTLRDGDADPLAIRSVLASANLFDVLGSRPFIGRTFADDEDAGARNQVAILSYGLWQRAFGGDSAVVGRSITLSDVQYQVIGVMPEPFSLGFQEQLWVPLDVTPVIANAARARKFHWLYGIARLKPGITPEAASTDLNTTARALAEKHSSENAGHFVTVMPIQSALVGDSRPTMLALLGAAALVLLIACANLMNMMLARAVARRREMTVRAAIGAGRGHLIRQLLTESLVLSLAGGLLGAALAVMGVRLVATFGAALLPPIADLSLDWRLFAIGITISVIVGAVLGLVPAVGAWRLDLNAALQDSSRGAVGSRRGDRLRGGLVFIQVATAVVLLAGAGLLVRSLDALTRVNLGFDPDHLMSATIGTVGPRYQSNDALNPFYDQLLTRIRTAPGVVAAGAVSNAPLSGSSSCGLTIEGRPAPDKGYFEVKCGGVRGDYFKALGAPLIAGRTFDATDLPTGPQVVVVNAALTRQFFPNENAVGKRIRLGPDPTAPWQTVIGVVGDMRQVGLDVDPAPTAYEYDPQHGWGTLSVVVRAAGDGLAAAPLVREAVRAIDPAITVRNVQSMDQIIGGNLATRRFSLGVILAFALLALVLSAVGVYGVLAYMVTSRTREFGVRMALGASATTVRSLILRTGYSWALPGVVVGIGVALAGGKWIQGMLFQVPANDAPTFVAVGAFLLVVVTGACLVPAIRATRVDPVITLRQE